MSMVGDGLARKVINHRVGRIKRVFKWAASEQLVPPGVHAALASVAGLQKGRTDARETAPVGPVSDDDVETLPHLSRHIAGMVRLQRLTGMRPGEVCELRRADIDTTGPVWQYHPSRHKTAWRGKPRVVPIGPRAQSVLAEFLTAAPDEFVFSPRRLMAERRVALRTKRKTAVQPSQVCRKKARPKRRPGDHYTSATYAQAVRKAAAKAGVPVWSPNQLRHTRGTEVRQRYGLDAAQVFLGHSQANVTEVYAEADGALASKVALETG